MASMETRSLFWFTSIGSYCKFLPYNQDLRDYSCIISEDPATGDKVYGPLVYWGDGLHRKLYRILNGFTMFMQLAAVSGGLWLDWNFSLSLINRLQLYFLMSVVLLFLGLQLTTLLYSQRMFTMQNSYLLICMRLYDLHKIDQREKDGVEIFLKIMIIISFSCVAVLPLWIWFMDLNIVRFLRVILGPGILPGDGDGDGDEGEMGHKAWTMVGMILTPLGASPILLQGLVSIFHYSSMALVYTNTVCRSLRLSHWKPDRHCSHQRLHALIIFYKGHIIYHNYVMEEASRVVLMSIVFAGVILTSSLFAGIKYYGQFHPLLLLLVVSAAVFAFVISKILFQLANVLTDLSLEFRSSYLRNEWRLGKEERLRLKSCKEMEICAGSLFKVTRASYVTFLSDVVVQNVINLIISYS